MESLPRVAYGPSPPLGGHTRGKGRHGRGGRSSSSPPSAGSATTPHAAAEGSLSGPSASRRLVEAYWQSVRDAHHAAPLYHTFSDRYGGTHGVPYAARGVNIAAAASVGNSGAGEGSDSSVPLHLAAAASAFEAGHLAGSKMQLEKALTLLQNDAIMTGTLTVQALKSAREGDEQRSLWLAEVFRRLGTIELIRGHYVEAMSLLDASVSVDPLYLDVYLLRASCSEAQRNFEAAYADYAKYVSMSDPSLEVLAHSGKCAAEARLADVAQEQLSRLLTLAESLLNSMEAPLSSTAQQNDAPGLPPLLNPAWAAASLTTTQLAAPPTNIELLRTACAFYVAHAHFYLGYVAENASLTPALNFAEAAQLRAYASGQYAATLRNADYVRCYEESVEQCMLAQDYPLAQELLRYLQSMNPAETRYYVCTATACRAEGDVDGELRALSAALDRAQTRTQRRETLLARGAVCADKLEDWSRAIRDFTLLLAIPAAPTPSPDATGSRWMDWATPLALVRRAYAYRRRHTDASRSAMLRREDKSASLADYAAFLDALTAITESGTVDAESVPEPCQPQAVIAALLVLANGAHRTHQHSRAVHYFSRAIALGWDPAAPTAVLPESERLPDQLYLSLAHHFMHLYPLPEDVLRVPYEAREAGSVPASSTGTTNAGATASGGETRRMIKAPGTLGGGRTVTSVAGSDGDRGGFACPPLLYISMEQHYQRLRGLEPTVFAAVEDAFLDVWEPYRTEVERLREDAQSTRGGRRGKR